MRDPSCGQASQASFFFVKSTYGLEILVRTAQGGAHSLEHPREEELFVTLFGPKRFPFAGRIDCSPRCTSWRRRPPRARPSCRTAGPCWKTARAQRAKDEHPPPHHGPRPRRELANAHIVVPRRRRSVKAKLVVRPRALMPEAIWSMKPNMQSAADASRTWCAWIGVSVLPNVDMSKTSTYSPRTCLVTLMCVSGIGHEDS